MTTSIFDAIYYNYQTIIASVSIDLKSRSLIRFFSTIFFTIFLLKKTYSSYNK